MTTKEFKAKFLGAMVRITGLHPGKESEGYKHGPAIMKDIFDIGFSCANITFLPDYYRELGGKVYGFYTAGAYPEEPGIVVIEFLTKNCCKTCSKIEKCDESCPGTGDRCLSCWACGYYKP